MFIIDDLLMSPANLVLWIFKQVHEAAEEELAGEAQRITGHLSELHLMLERGQISEQDFEAEEEKLLDRLEELEEIEGDSDGRQHIRRNRGGPDSAR